MSNIKASIIKEEKISGLKDVSFDSRKISPFLDSIERPYDTALLETLVRESTILPQCINAYKRNIAGFGIEPKFKDQEDNSNLQNQQEFERLSEVLSFLSIEKPLKEVFEEMIRERETFGYSFLEVIQNEIGEVVEVLNIDSTTVDVLKGDGQRVSYQVYRNGKVFTRTKCFRKYCQKIGNQKIFFKEFGDPRIMNCFTGEYDKTMATPIESQANSIVSFKIGYGHYGTPRWEGPMLTIQGARKAEKLNWNYFNNGRHTPMMILVKGGTLTDESWGKLQEYMNGIKGDRGQHGFLVLEAEKVEGKTAFDESDKVEVEIKDLSGMLQHDELFQNYMENHRKKTQSSFNLPDIYVGYSQDYNVATAKEVVRKTEEQVFVPERESLEWTINQQLLGSYGFKNVYASFNTPDVENTEHQFKMFTVASRSMTPNQALTEYYNSINRPYEVSNEEWANIPQYIQEVNSQKTMNQLSSVITKAQQNKDEDIVIVLKEVKKALESLQVEEVDYP